MKVCKFPRYKALSSEENVHAMAMFQRRTKLDELFGGIMDELSAHQIQQIWELFHTMNSDSSIKKEKHIPVGGSKQSPGKVSLTG